ncbi:hypothetical protein K5549_006063 [Capra hircus]|uniref:Uncharacterized protein n=1 Tax=Capra hircus TaxID=9925 RepID=A0A452ENM6_CAPHI|nr:hypothetical protein K5549_006063 [Capra hircus]
MMAEESLRILKKPLTQASSNQVKTVSHGTRLGLRIRHPAARRRRTNYNSPPSARRAAPIVRHSCEGRGLYKPRPGSEASFYPAAARRWCRPGCHGRRTCRGCL